MTTISGTGCGGSVSPRPVFRGRQNEPASPGSRMTPSRCASASVSGVSLVKWKRLLPYRVASRGRLDLVIDQRFIG